MSPTKSDSANIGKNVVGNDQGHGKEKPDHALKNVVHDKMGLHHDQVERHVGPCKLRKLEFVVALLQGDHKENEACLIVSVGPMEELLAITNQ